jgi:hypothetical protein
MRKCTLEKVSDNGKKMQAVQVHGVAGELLDGLEHYQPYGLSTVPVAIDEQGRGAEGLLTDVYGSKLRVVQALADRRFRPVVGVEGDVQVYHRRDDQFADADEATCRITLTDDETDDEWRLIVRIGDSTIEAKRNGDLTITNGQSTVKLDKTASNLKLTRGAASITLTNSKITLDAGTIELKSSDIKLGP